MQGKKPPGARKMPGKKPMTKEDAIRQMVERNPEKAAAMLREILNRKQDPDK